MLTLAKMREIACVLESTALHRLREHCNPNSLITFEGTVLDRLCLHFVQQAWQRQNYSIVCSVRPCMDMRLQQEVEQFAVQNDYPLVGYEGDCKVDRLEEKFVSVRCDNISSVIFSYLHGKDGQLVLSGLLNGWSQGYFQAINEEMKSFSIAENSFHVFQPGRQPTADWQTLFLFEGFYPIEILSTYLCKVSMELDLYHIPTCYLSCHNELQQEAMQDRLEYLKKLLNPTE